MASSPRAVSCRQISSPIPRFAPVTTHVAMVHLLSREASIEDEVVERLYDDADDALSRDAARSDRDEVTLGPRLVHFGGDRREERAEEHRERIEERQDEAEPDAGRRGDPCLVLL